MIIRSAYFCTNSIILFTEMQERVSYYYYYYY